MKKDTAALIVDAVVSLDKGLGTLSTVIGQIDDEEESSRYGKAFGEVLRLFFESFLLPIERKYPDLNPDK